MRINIINKILAVVCTIGFLVLVIAIIKDRVDENAYTDRMEQAYNVINEQINELYTRRDELNHRIEEIREEADRQNDGRATVTFLFKNPDDDLIRSAKDVLDKNSCKGDIAVSVDAFPGDPGCISRTDMKELTGDGWGIVIAPEKAGDVGDAASKIGRAGLPKARAVYLEADFDPEEIDDTIEQAARNGIKVILADASLNIETDADSEMQIIRTEEYRVYGIKDRTLNAIDNGDSIALAVGPAKHTEKYPYDEEVFSSMLSVIIKRVKTGECDIVSAGRAGKRQEEKKKLLETLVQKEETEIAQLEAEIEAVNARIQDIHKGPDGIMATPFTLPEGMAGATVREDGNPVSRIKEKTKNFLDELKEKLYEML